MTVREFKAMRERGDDIAVLDVREAGELDLARLPDVIHIPLAMVPLRAQELDASRPLVVMCHKGVRSAMAVRWLREHGFENAINLAGGIDAYSLEADPAIPRY
jgi:rhodanese-related sulfurtransferase